MEKLIARYLFSEMPYAAALYRQHLNFRCSFCFSNLGDQHCKCDQHCPLAWYCSDSCRDQDRPLHESECSAARQRNPRPKDPFADLSIRLLARMIGRYQIDKGIASLSQDFPAHMAPVRCFDDLMSHKNDVRRSTKHDRLFKETKAAFYDFFSGVPMGSTKPETLFLYFCRYSINGFVVNVRVRPEPGCCEGLGEAVYLNASRFNHACFPTCSYVFKGARLVIQYFDRETREDSLDDPATFAKPPKLTKKQFDELTVHYGFGSFHNYGTACPLTEQRQASLESRYFFRCQCDLCSNKLLNEIQHNAALVECSSCSWPYVWRRSFFRQWKLKKSCQCHSDKRTRENDFKMAPWLLEPGVGQKAKLLDKEWKAIMQFIRERSGSIIGYEKFTPTAELAAKYWHPKYNLRFGHLQQKIFDYAWFMIADNFVPPEERAVSDEVTTTAITAGEAMLDIYLTYFNPGMLLVHIYAQDLGRLYKKRSAQPDDDDSIRSLYWFSFAVDQWKRRGELGCAQFVEDQAAEQDEQ